MLTASPSFLIDGSQSIILDTSAAINLNATGRMEDILRALPCAVAVTEILLNELKRGVEAGYSDYASITELLRKRQIDVVGLCDVSGPYFEGLVVGSAAETLDDGEAATIAQAIALNSIAVIDERKATSICSARYPEVRLISSIELMLQTLVTEALGREGLRDAVINALQIARMQVPKHLGDKVVDLIGEEAAKACPSLPKYLR